MSTPPASSPKPGTALLALDTASPTVSVAALRWGADGAVAVVAERSLAQRRSSAVLLRLVDEVLREAGEALGDLDGLVAVRGPGSFTGLRVGLATVLGLHQATALPATALSSFEVLATAAGAVDGDEVLTVVDARRGDYFVQRYTAGAVPVALDEPRRMPLTRLPDLGVSRVVGHSLGALRADAGWAPGTRWVEAGALAATAARLVARRDGPWDAGLLTRPLYLEAPAVGPPAR
ncbi:MAG: tRNA (adenosine(37)-N6)-threonylcarbamoyltransferase complex dimerization subunit type 1 TsaB [Acidobacteria bacterium]|nr:tRNA (adenosine(37)-N6)-threonylcarbamoyltransferase complex dimerization subunit type 1 TsaB [Acidobacteriota bacterium]